MQEGRRLVRSTLLPLGPGGGLRAFSGGPPAALFFTFDRIFEASNRPPENETRQDIIN